MLFSQFPVGPLQCNCSILACEETREAIVIDPGDEAERIAQALKEQGLTLKYLLHTHAHFDHVGGTVGLQQACGGLSCLHEDDLFLFENVALQTRLFGVPTPPMGKIDEFLAERDVIRFGRHEIEIFHTPGHTPGSLSFYSAERRALFSGDTLFARGIGRTDLWGGDYGTLQRSIRQKLLPLGDEVQLYPGHGPQSTLGEEKRFNPFLQE